MIAHKGWLSLLISGLALMGIAGCTSCDQPAALASAPADSSGIEYIENTGDLVPPNSNSGVVLNLYFHDFNTEDLSAIQPFSG